MPDKQKGLDLFTTLCVAYIAAAAKGDTDVGRFANAMVLCILNGEIINPIRYDGKDGEHRRGEPVLDKDGALQDKGPFEYGIEISNAFKDLVVSLGHAESRRKTSDEVKELNRVLDHAAYKAGRMLTSKEKPKGLQWSEEQPSYSFRVDISQGEAAVIKSITEGLTKPEKEGQLPNVERLNRIIKGLQTRSKEIEANVALMIEGAGAVEEEPVEVAAG